MPDVNDLMYVEKVRHIYNEGTDRWGGGQKKEVEREVKIFTFDSWGSMLEYSDKRISKYPENKYDRTPASRRTATTEGYYEEDWYQTKNFEEALDLGINGWPEGREKANIFSSAIVDKVSSLIEKQDIEYDVVGQDFDIGLVMQGVPECWYTLTTRIVDGQGSRQLKLVFNNCVSAGIDTEVMTRKGAAAVALIQCLELAGFRVEVSIKNGLASGYQQGASYIFQCVLKEASQPVDIDRIIFALAHPSAFRRIGFSIFEGDKEFMDAHSSGYGYPAECPREMRGDIYIGSSLLGGVQWETEEATQKWILGELRRQGIKLIVPDEE